MKTLLLAAAAAAVLAIAGQASAATQVSVNTTDLVYGPFSGSVAVGATGAAATLSWMSAGFDWDGNIALTNSAGVILDDIQTGGDVYTLFAPGSGDAAIGTTCVASGSTACVIATGLPQSLASTITAMNGGWGICCFGYSDLVVTVSSGLGVPEPQTWALMLAGFGLAGVALRRRATAPLAA